MINLPLHLRNRLTTNQAGGHNWRDIFHLESFQHTEIPRKIFRHGLAGTTPLPAWVRSPYPKVKSETTAATPPLQGIDNKPRCTIGIAFSHN